MCTAIPPMSSPADLDLAGVQADTNVEMEVEAASRMAHAQRMARAGPSNVARKPSPVVFTSRPRNVAV